MGTSRGAPLAGHSISASARGVVFLRWVERCPAAAPASSDTAATVVSARCKIFPQLRKAMQIHDKAPDFSLPDQNGQTVSLKDFRGKTVVLYFFPKADTPG